MTETEEQSPFIPALHDPYHGDGDISAFRYETDLIILRKRDAVRMGGDREADYIVAAPYRVSFISGDERRVIEVPRGMLTDLASVPRLFRWLVERVGPHLEAAIVHDFLYIAWQDLGREPTREDWLYANRVMMAGIRAAGVGRIMRALIAFGLSTPFAWAIYRRRNPAPRYIDLGDGQSEPIRA